MSEPGEGSSQLGRRPGIVALMRRVALVSGVVGAVALLGCAAEQARVDQRRRDLSAAALGTPSPSLLSTLTPEERAALDRFGMAGASQPDEEGEEPVDDGGGEEGGERASETAGKVGVAVLQVGLTLGMLAAPFFLF